MLRYFIAVIVILVNLTIGSCLALFFWLAGGWMVDDSQADRFTTADWSNEGIGRALTGLMVAVVVGAVTAFVTRFIFGKLFPDRRRPHWLLAGFAGWLVAAGAIAGCIQFLTEKPYM